MSGPLIIDLPSALAPTQEWLDARDEMLELDQNSVDVRDALEQIDEELASRKGKG